MKDAGKLLIESVVSGRMSISTEIISETADMKGVLLAEEIKVVNDIEIEDVRRTELDDGISDKIVLLEATGSFPSSEMLLVNDETGSDEEEDLTAENSIVDELTGDVLMLSEFDAEVVMLEETEL